MTHRPSKYDRQASRYDTRWSRYLAGSLDLARAHLFANPGETLLDVGCGTGLLLAQIVEREPDVRTLGVDVSREMLQVARRRLPPSRPLLAGRAEALPVATASYDWVVSTSHLHFVGDYERALDEIHRVLRARGRVVFVDWCSDHLWTRAVAVWTRITEGRGIHVFGVEEIRELLQAHHFDQVEIRRARVGTWGLMVATARRA